MPTTTVRNTAFKRLCSGSTAAWMRGCAMYPRFAENYGESAKAREYLPYGRSAKVANTLHEPHPRIRARDWAWHIGIVGNWAFNLVTSIDVRLQWHIISSIEDLIINVERIAKVIVQVFFEL